MHKKTSFFELSFFLILLFLGFFIAPISAQPTRFESNPPADQSKTSKFSDRLRYGGFSTLQLGDITFIELSPRITYMINDFSGTGFGATYSYFNNRVFQFSNSLYGGQAFYWRELFTNIIGQAEYEMFNITPWNQIGFENPQRTWAPGLLLGGGLSQPTGTRGQAFVMILYNVLWDPNRSLYNRPWIVRVGFAF
jgi:hypothetical protein